ncbi:udp-n-acetylglucosamine--peptide n-acetylglucosaminyltransferase-like protein, partial [Dinothrombium tinctorium]
NQDISFRFSLPLDLKYLRKTSQKQECDDYEQLKLYPSIFGFQSCQFYAVGGEPDFEKIALCNSTGIIKSAIFLNDDKFGLLECFQENDFKFTCHPRTKLHTVCACNYECEHFSVANNLPITSQKKSRKVISFSLYGNNSDYYCGALRQVRLAKLFLPEWSSRIYVNSSVPLDVIRLLENEAEVIRIPDASPLINSGMFWRFLVADDDQIDAYCIRDTDSVFSYREADAIQQWLESGKSFHSIRDHPYHDIHMLGGLWCGRKRIPEMMKIILSFAKRDKRQNDQQFLNSKIWPKIRSDVLIHDSFPKKHPDKQISKPFRIERIGCEFIGVAIVSTYDIAIPNQLLRSYLN